MSNQIQNTNILPQILKYFSNTEQQQLRCICRNWKERIENDFGIAILITNENWPWTSTSKGVRIATFHSFTGRFPATVSFIPTLQEITFHRILVTNNLISILQKCLKIRSLTFSRIILDRNQEVESPYPFHLRRLTRLQIHIPNTSELHNDYNLLIVFLNSIIYGTLKEFSLWCPTHHLKNLALSDLSGNGHQNNKRGISYWVSELLQKNRGTLESVTFGPWRFPINFLLNSTLNREFPKKPMQMDGIEIFSPFPKSWENVIIGYQHYLQWLYIKEGAFRIWEESRKAIIQSSHVISQIILIDETEQKKEINLDIFKECQNLIRLTLKLNNATFKNTHCFPPLLKTLNLKGNFTREQFSHFANGLVNLEILDIDNCEKNCEGTWIPSSQGDIGQMPTVDTIRFKKLIMLPKLKELTLGNCSLNWNSILNWCVLESGSEYRLKTLIQRFNGTPFGLRVMISERFLDKFLTG